MKILSLVILLLSLAAMQPAQAQKRNILWRYINSLVNDTGDISKPQLLVFPNIGYAPETKWDFGVTGLYVYYPNRDTTNRMSELNAFAFYTLERQYGFWFDNAVYTQNNDWFILGRIRLQSFPLLYHGIGTATPKEYIARVDAHQIQIRERVLRKVVEDFYIGVEGDYQRLSNVTFNAGNTNAVETPLGYQGSTNVGLGLGLIYDTRHNVLNVRHGQFSELAFLRYENAFGSHYTFTNIVTDSRIYRPVNKRDVIAAQLLGQFNLGETPFNMLSLLGGENIMRGYYMGRFRDRNQIATQIEYRLLPLPLGFTNRLGAAFFAGAGTVFDNFNNLQQSKLLWSGGGGLRVLVFPKKDIFTRIDVAFTNEGRGFYVVVGEAF